MSDSERSERTIEFVRPETIEKSTLGSGRSDSDSARVCGSHRHVHGSVISFMNDNFGMRMLFAKWVPRLPTIDPKCNCTTTSKEGYSTVKRMSLGTRH